MCVCVHACMCGCVTYNTIRVCVLKHEELHIWPELKVLMAPLKYLNIFIFIIFKQLIDDINI